jgi:hypothetical protein
VASFGGPAQAHYVYDKGIVHLGDFCVGGRSEISHGHGGGYSKVDVYSTTTIPTPLGDYDCELPLQKPRFYMKVKIDLMVYDAFLREWKLCQTTGDRYNPRRMDHYKLTQYWEAPCGSGLRYATNGWVWTKDSTSWYGGALWSDEHLLPADSKRKAGSASSSAPTPTWVRPDGTVDIAKIPDSFEVAGPNGESVLDESGNPLTVPVEKDPNSSPQFIDQ